MYLTAYYLGYFISTQLLTEIVGYFRGNHTLDISGMCITYCVITKWISLCQANIDEEKPNIIKTVPPTQTGTLYNQD